MPGSLQIKGNMYYAVLSVTDENGKHKTKWISLKIPAIKGNKRKAESELKRIVQEADAQNDLNVSSDLFCEYLKNWLDEHRCNISLGTYESCKGDVIEIPVFLALQFGLRRSEALGLRWDAVDFDNEVIHIRHTVVRVKTLVEKESTKNKSSTRTLPMLGSAKDYLKAVKANQEEKRRLCGNAYIDSGYVYCLPDGKPLEPSLVSHKFKKLLQRLGLPAIRFHDLRHSAASILVSMGCNVKQISAFLGHNQVSTTLDIYSHLFNSASIDLMRQYDSVLSGGKNEKTSF